MPCFHEETTFTSVKQFFSETANMKPLQEPILLGARKPDNYPGIGMEFRRKSDNVVVIRSKVGPPLTSLGSGRLGYEKLLYSSIEYGLKSWERSHAQGQGTGYESAAGITYAQKIVNRQYMGAIEKFIREAYRFRKPDVDFYLETAVSPHPGTRRLARIEYRLDACVQGRMRSVLEAVIEVSNSRTEPRISVDVTPRADIEEFLV